MKLNNKGYMLVEIIVSFAFAFSILIALTNLLLKYKDTSEDVFYETKYLKDKTLITRNIMEDLEPLTITNVTQDTPKNLRIDYQIINESNELITGTKVININGNTIKYGNYVSSTIQSDKTYYVKKMESTLKVGNIQNCSDLSKGYFCAEIEVSSIYGKENYNLILFSTNVVSQNN